MNIMLAQTQLVDTLLSSSLDERFTQAIELLLSENERVLRLAIQPAITQLTQKVMTSDHIFVCGEGRSGLVARMIAMRLMHLGYQVYVVGETTTPSIRADDLLIAYSGSGSTSTICTIAAEAKTIGAYLVGVTANRSSPLADRADLAIELAAATKQELNSVKSQQFAGSLFEQSALLLFDALFYVLAQLLHKDAQALWQLHNNLE